MSEDPTKWLFGLLPLTDNPGPLTETDIYCIADLLVKLRPGDALAHAQELRREHAINGDAENADAWHQISEAIEVLQAKATGMLH